MKKIIIVGTGSLAEDAYHDLQSSSTYEVVGFLTSTPESASTHWFGLPVVLLSNAASEYLPETHHAVVALGFENLNRDRADCCKWMKDQGYELVDCVSPLAHAWSMRSTSVGENRQFGARSVIHPTAKIGKNVIIGAGVLVAHFCTIEDDCYIDSGAIINGSVTIGSSSYIGAKANLRNRLRIGARSVIGAGALVMDDLGEGEVCIGKQTSARA